MFVFQFASTFLKLVCSVQISTPPTAEGPGGAPRARARACQTLAQPRRWRSANYEVRRGNHAVDLFFTDLSFELEHFIRKVKKILCVNEFFL